MEARIVIVLVMPVLGREDGDDEILDRSIVRPAAEFHQAVLPRLYRDWALIGPVRGADSSNISCRSG
jgi:hypothetical protein